MVSSHLRHFGTLSSAGEGVGGGGGLKKWKYQLFWNISIYPLTFFQFFLGTGVWNWNLQHQFKSISCAVCIYFSDKFYSCLFPCPNFCPRFFAVVFLPSMFCPCPFFCPQVLPLPLPSKCQQKWGQGQNLFFALSFISPCILPPNLAIALALFFALVFRAKKRARARAKFEGKIHGEMNQRAKKRAKPETTRMPP